MLKFLGVCLSLIVSVHGNSLSPIPIQTDRVVFLFDTGEKNMVASMLNYAIAHDKERLDQLDFRIVFMGTSLDALSKEPFSFFSDKMIDYRNLGIVETIDNHWKRDQKISDVSLKALQKNLIVRKKIWVGVPILISLQIMELFKENTQIEIAALRDNPSPNGDTDYFTVAEIVQKNAKKILVPSKEAAQQIDPNKKVSIIGHGPIEDWMSDVQQIEKDAVIKRLGLNPLLPIIVYAGSYGGYYKGSFEKFLMLLPDEEIQVLVVPHPRYRGIVELELCRDMEYKKVDLRVVGEFENNPLKKIKTVEALSIADIVVTSDALSTIVFQANALGKKVFYVNEASSAVSEDFNKKQLIKKISSTEEFSHLLKSIQKDKENSEDVFLLLGIPKNGAQLLWEEFIK